MTIQHVRGNVRLVEIAAPMIEMVFVTGWMFPPRTGELITCLSGLPDGATLRGCEFDPLTRQIRLLFEHESFEPVPEGEPIPHLKITFGQRTEGMGK